MFDRFFRAPFVTPAFALAMLCLMQAGVWIVIPEFIQQGPPENTVEAMAWGREWIIAGPKHPALSGWLLEMGRLLLGPTALSTYVVAELSAVVTMVFTYLFACDVLGDRWRALAATALMQWLLFLWWPSIAFDPDPAQMPFWAITLWATLRASRTNRPVYWAVAGAAGALSLYAKFSGGLLLAAIFIWLLADRQRRGLLVRPPALLGLAVFAAAVAPLLWEIVHAGFVQFHYVGDQLNTAPPKPVGYFLAILGITLLPLFASFAVLAQQRPVLNRAALKDDGVQLALIAWLLPLATFTVLAPFKNVPAHWLTMVFSVVGIVILGLLRWTTDRNAALRLWTATLALTLIIGGVYGGIRIYRDQTAMDPPDSQSMPQRLIANELAAHWKAATTLPLRIVAGSVEVAGALAFWNTSEPHYLHKASFAESPWVTMADIRRDGALLAWQDGDPAAENIKAIAPAASVQTLSLPWSNHPGRPPMTIHYAILLPQAGN